MNRIIKPASKYKSDEENNNIEEDGEQISIFKKFQVRISASSAIYVFNNDPLSSFFLNFELKNQDLTCCP